MPIKKLKKLVLPSLADPNKNDFSNLLKKFFCKTAGRIRIPVINWDPAEPFGSYAHLIVFPGYDDDIAVDGKHDEEESTGTGQGAGTGGAGGGGGLLVCPACPDRPPVRDLARHNHRYHREKKVRGNTQHQPP